MARTDEASTHEDYSREPERAHGPSDRSFGITFAVVFVIIAAWPAVFHGGGVRLWSLGVAALFLLAALVRPGVLGPLNRLWLGFGLLLHRIVSPVILGLLFYLTVLPTGFALRLFGRRPLRLRFEPEADSYWIRRDPPGPEPDTMERQF